MKTEDDICDACGHDEFDPDLDTCTDCDNPRGNVPEGPTYH